MAANEKVTVHVGGDGTGFHRAMSGVEERVKRFVGLAEGLKGALAGALGGFTIGEIVKSMSEFARSIEDASKRLHLTIKEVYNLKRATQEAGQSWESMFKANDKAEEFLAKIANYQATPQQMAVASKYGLKGDEASGMTAALSMLRQGANRSELAELVGQKEAGIMTGNRKSFLNQSKSVDAEAISKMARLSVEMELLTDEIKAGVIPALIGFVDGLMSYSRKVLQFDAKALVSFEQAIKTPGFLTSKGFKWEREAFKQFMNTWDGIAEGDKNSNKAIEDKRKEMIKAYEREQKELKLPVDRKRPFIMSGELPSNQFLKVGGLLGVDTNYRLERLSKKQLETQMSMLDQLIMIQGLLGGGSEQRPNTLVN